MDAFGSKDNDNIRLLRIEEIAQLCGVSTKTVTRWIEKDGLPIHRLPGNGQRPITRVAEDDLEQWRQQYRQEAVADDDDEPVLRLDGIRFFKDEE